MSASVNKVLLLGNLGSDPEVRYQPDGRPLARLSVATSTMRRQADGSALELREWHRVLLSDELAVLARDQLRRGSQVWVEGRLHTERWRDQAGLEHKMTVIEARRVLILGSHEARPATPAPGPADMSWLDQPAPDLDPGDGDLDECCLPF